MAYTIETSSWSGRKRFCRVSEDTREGKQQTADSQQQTMKSEYVILDGRVEYLQRQLNQSNGSVFAVYCLLFAY